MKGSDIVMSNTEEMPKRYKFKDIEKYWRDRWDEEYIYKFHNNQVRENTFVVDSPPPTVSGSLHIGHVFSYTHQDLIVRYQRMIGKDIYYPMGWDDNGLPTERRVQNLFNVRINPELPYDEKRIEEVKNRKKKKDIIYVSRTGFIELCNEITKVDERVFQDMWKTVGLSIDWKEEYATVDDHCRRLSQYSFIKLLEQGAAYKMERPTMWDVDFQTAIAQAEVEDKEVEGNFHDIRFYVEGEGDFIISTTRPELLAACVAVVAHPDDDRYKHLFGKKAITPLFFSPVPIIADERAEIEKGTGILMVCTFGDSTDVEWWNEYKLPLRQIIDTNGRLVSDIDFDKKPFESINPDKANKYYSEIAGKTVKQAKKKMVELLSDKEASANPDSGEAPLKGEPKPVKHAVKFYEKGDRPLEFITTRQWFIKILENKDKLLEKAREIKWHPPHMIHRIEHWINGLNTDWCISRQRFFGVPFPVWYPLDDKGNVLYDKPITYDIENVEDLKNKLPVDPMTATPKGYDESQRNKPKGFTADKDIMDTWATSSLTPQIGSYDILDPERHKKLFPADIRPQSHEIIRTWAFYTIAKAMYHYDSIPWYNILISGWILDPDRKKMSKSKGNVVTPIDLLEKYSSDGVRYWAASARFGVDTAFDEDVFKVGKKLANKIYNASRFAFGIIKDFDYSGMSADMIREELDRSIIDKLRNTVDKATKYFDKFNFTDALASTEWFFWNDFCDNYLELVKRRAYNEDEPEKRRSAQATLSIVLSAVLRLFAPFVPYVTEEVWRWYFRDKWNDTSIHLSGWPKLDEFSEIEEPKSKEAFNSLCEILSSVRKSKSVNHYSMKWPVESLYISSAGKSKEDWESVQPMLEDFKNAGNIVGECQWSESNGEEGFSETEHSLFKVKVELAEEDK
jgi:valyl-tRNA synthetase